MIRETSRLAYESIDLTARQSDVLNAMRALGECTDQEIADRLGWGVHRVSGRRGELVDKQAVERCGRKINSNGNPAYVWRLTLTKSQPSFQYDTDGQGVLLA